ncbi:hypothetical protein A4H97_13385 [Niastella yeongjuensis]|uniref:HMA domain-containing protein n=1 Tax=Niastella yeongjuensis TaxID=354355 RepID=A0A1V9EAS9_9BACT|nr:hypothetical protein [Niastella yeongjuensis]OQP43223.1 hypothetical protein A4H97_13385 [Niastella yeongjuensis]
MNNIKLASYAKRTLRVLVFKTNLVSAKDIHRISPLMGDTAGILRWNVDEHDIDNVLRIETSWLLPGDIIRMVTDAGYLCEELPD